MRKKLPKDAFTFSAPLTKLDRQFAHAAVTVPAVILKQLPEGRLRVKGFLNSAPIDLAIQNVKNGPRFLMVSKVLARQAKVVIGDRVTVTFQLTNPDKIDVPEELQAVLAQDDEAMAAWRKLTPGLQRSLSYYVKSVKNIDSRIKRSFEMLHKVKTGQLYRQRKNVADRDRE